MPQLDDNSYTHLKRLVGDVSFRAGRLREWIALGRSLRVLSGSFAPFNVDVKTGAATPATINTTRLNETLRTMEDNPLVELEGLRAANGMHYINRALVPNGSGDLDATVAQWVDQILELAAQIRASLNGLMLKELSDRCEKLDEHLTRVMRRHRAFVDKETDELYYIAATLATRLDN